MFVALFRKLPCGAPLIDLSAQVDFVLGCHDHQIWGPVTLWTLKSDHGRCLFSMVRVHGPTSMIQLLKNIVLKVMGSSLGVNGMWTKKNDHVLKSQCADFFVIHAQKGRLWKKLKFNHSLVFFWASLVFYFLLNVSKMWLANFLTTENNEQFNLYMFNVQINLHVTSPCVVTMVNRIFSVWLCLMLLLSYLAQN